MSELQSKNNTFARVNDDGLIEIVDEITGEVVALQESLTDIFKLKPDRLAEHQLADGRTVLLEKGLSLDKVAVRQGYAYSSVIADIICQRIAEGESITKICKDPNMPNYTQLTRWRRIHSDFDEAVVMAMKDRGHYLRDKVVDITDEDLGKNEVPGARLRADIYKWAAEKDNPDTFGSKTKVVGDENAPLRLIIETGVPAPRDVVSLDGVNEEPSEEIREEISGKTEAVFQDAIASADSGGDAGKVND